MQRGVRICATSWIERMIEENVKRTFNRIDAQARMIVLDHRVQCDRVHSAWRMAL